MGFLSIPVSLFLGNIIKAAFCSSLVHKGLATVNRAARLIWQIFTLEALCFSSHILTRGLSLVRHISKPLQYGATF